MAFIDVNFDSKALNRQVTYKAIIPAEQSEPNTKFKTLYLLHGITGDNSNWLILSRVILTALRNKLAVIMPSGDNSFYVDQEAMGNNYGEYIGKELVEETRKLFPLSDKREDTFIGGLSMGGYGAFRNGLKYHDTFGAIIGLSSALIMDIILNSTDDADWKFLKRSYYQAVFGDLSKLKGSDNDIEALVLNIKNNNGKMPRIYMACGTEDELISNNREFRDFLLHNQVDNSYEEGPGVHDWKFWDLYINKAINWLLY